MEETRFTFIDLFAGIGGFHEGLSRIGGECVFAVEKNAALHAAYAANFPGLSEKQIAHDIREIETSLIPDYDLLCAGFPCQPFSKAGKRLGLEDPDNGNLFSQILRLIDGAQAPPKFLLLENVPNILSLDNGNTWQAIIEELNSRGFSTFWKILSPRHFGRPQGRKRVFLVGIKGKLSHFNWPEATAETSSILPFLESAKQGARNLTKFEAQALKLWEYFIKNIDGYETIGFPIWSNEWGADYDVNFAYPIDGSMGFDKLTKGNFGLPIAHGTPILNEWLPPYANICQATIPMWKANFIKKNRELYHKNKGLCLEIRNELKALPHSLQKMEWNCQREQRHFKNKVIQFRPSGVRVRGEDGVPTLVAMNKTQTPYFTRKQRFMTLSEGLKMQGLHSHNLEMISSSEAWKAIGNAVHADIVELIAKELLKTHGS